MNYIWWGIQFLPSGELGYMKMLDGVCQNIYTDTGVVVDQSLPMEYVCVSMDMPAPAWYDPATNTP